MDQLDHAIHDTAHNSDISAEQLAQGMGLGYQVFLNKTNSHAEQNKLSVREAMAMILGTKKTSILEVMCQMAGGEFVPGGAVVSQSVTSAVLAAVAESGDVCRVLDEALSDGVITPREEAAIRQQISEQRQALTRLEAAVAEKSKGSLVDIASPRQDGL